jgi:murein DD-endopeptidase MepM/ murein hydrolase activator NlpD
MLAPPPVPVEITQHSVAPLKAYFAGPEVRIGFRFRGLAPRDVRVDIARRGHVVKHFVLRGADPARRQRIVWNGLTTRGRPAPDGRYVVRAALGTRAIGRFTFHGHKYPIRGAHHARGGIGYFGAPRNGGRVHEGFDVDSPCGTPLVAARGGRVVYSAYDSVLYGNRVIIRGARSQRDYWYSHLAQPSRFRKGDRVRTGERIGRIGATGNARTVGCHLHFEIRARGRPIDPAPHLHAWDRWS